MGEWDQVIVSLWFIPVILFIILPLFVGCFWVLYHIFDVVKPIASQEKKLIKLKSPGEKTV